jgi:CDP-diacylglycerol--glycerol-3-phosphate 3-phosphatidyltransferase
MLTQRFQDWIRAWARRFVLTVHLSGITPNALTMTGLGVTAIAALLIGFGWLVAGGVVLIFAGLFDILDGAVARVTGKVNSYGAFLDSTTDRYAELFTYGALLTYFVLHGNHTVEPLLVIASLGGSLLVSYVRARAQSLGFRCDGGILARPERVIITVAGLMLTQFLGAAALVVALWVLAVLTNVTAVQRIVMVWRQARAMTAAEAHTEAITPSSVAPSPPPSPPPVKPSRRVQPEHR